MSSKSFSERYADLGDSAEDAYRTWAAKHKIAVEEWGLKRPDFVAFKDLPKNVRHQPDFISEALKKHNTPIPDRHFFVEAKGVGKDQIIKIKREDLITLDESHDFFGLYSYIFVNDVTYNRIGVIKAQKLSYYASIWDDSLIYDTFWEGKPYVGVPTDYQHFLLWESK